MEDQPTSDGASPRQRIALVRQRLSRLRPRLPGKRALIGGLVTLVVLLPFYLQFTLRAQEWLLSEARIEVATKLGSHGNALASALYRRLALLQSLRAYVRSELEGAPSERALIPEARFESFAAGLSVGTTGVTHFSVAPGARQRYVYPLAGNEDVLSADLLNDPCPDLRANVRRAIATQEMAVGWLREGCRDSQRLSAYLAVSDQDALWGLVGLVLDISPILYEAGIQAQPSGLDLALRDHTGMVLVGPSYVFQSDPIVHRIELPDGYWELAGIPTGGWAASIRGTLQLFQVAGLAIVALAVGLVGVIVTRQEYLTQMVRDRTAELVSLNRELQSELAERQRAEAALRDSEELYKTLVETSPDSVIMTDLNGVILSVSRRTVEWHGYDDAGDVVGMNAVDLVAPNHRPHARQQLLRPGGGGEPITVEYSLLRRDGTTFVGEIRATHIHDAAGEPRAILSATRDVTERRRAEEALQELAATLEDRVRQRTFEVQVLYELSQQIGFGLRDDELFRLTLQHARRVVPYDTAGVLLVSGDAFNIYIRPSRELTHHSERQLIDCLIANYGYVSGQVLDASRAHIHYLHHLPPQSQSATAPVPELGSVFQVPLVFSRRLLPNEAPADVLDHESVFQESPLGSERREVVGLLVVAAEEVGAFNEDQMRLVYTMASQASSALQRMRALLAAQQERLESLVENLPEGVLLLDVDLKPLLINPAAKHYLAALGGVMQEGCLTQLGGKALAPILRRADNRQPYELIAEGLPRRTFEAVARPLIDGGDGSRGVIRSWVLVLRDVTEERSVQERMQQQARLAAVGQLAAGIAHDFNNLLTSILGYSELAATDPELPEAFRDDMDVITRQGRRAADLVRQILDFSRKSISRQQPLDLAPFLRETVKLLQRTLPEHMGIMLESNRDEDYTVRADVTQMQQAITNLAINARDAMPEGGTLTFALSRLYLRAGEEPPIAWMPPGHWVRLSVTDTGTGIPEEVMPHLFEPFFTTKGPNQGTGLGLAQVYGIVKQHNGFIGVESQPGEGTTVIMYLPAQGAPQDQQALSDVPAGALPRGSYETTILVVEDEDAVRQISARTLESLGYNVLVSSDGIEALRLYDRHPGKVDLVLMDLVMPNMGGRDLLASLRERDPSLRVIVMSGYPLDVDVEEVLAGDHVEWLPKPLRLGDLAARVRAMLDGEGRGDNNGGDDATAQADGRDGGRRDGAAGLADGQEGA